MVNWTTKITEIYDFVNSNINASADNNDIKVYRSGDIEDPAMYLPCILISGYVGFSDIPISLSFKKIPVAKVEFFVNASSQESPAKTLDLVIEIAMNLYELILSNRQFKIVHVGDIMPTIIVNDQGQVCNIEYATVSLNLEIAL